MENYQNLTGESSEMKTAIGQFSFNDVPVRVDVDEEGNPWFVAKDVVASLGLEWKGSSQLPKIPYGWSMVRKLRTPGGEQKMVFLNEPAIYKLAFRSNKPSADRFTDWVASEILPSIRKNGSYIGDQTRTTRLANLTKSAAIMAEAYHKIGTAVYGCSPSLASAQTAQYLKREIGIDTTPLLGENIADVQDHLLNPTEIGKLLGLSAKKTNLKLEAHHLQTKAAHGKYWLLTGKGQKFAQIIDVGRKHSDNSPVQQIKWFKDKTIEFLTGEK